MNEIITQLVWEPLKWKKKFQIEIDVTLIGSGCVLYLQNPQNLGWRTTIILNK